MKKYSENRPWGSFEQFSENERCTVKIITISPNEEISLQYHRKRDEFWKILVGEATVVIGEKTFKGKEKDEFFIPKETKHRIKAEDSSVKILEIAFGEFDEKDIARLEDKYGRN